VRLFASSRRVFAAAVVVLLALFLLRPGASRLKARITNSISRAVARPAEIGSVHLRFLPRPGFDLENLVIYEDPAFGVEPMLRAPEVTAVVRITSLIRGHLDIARLELTEPSLNLVRRADGRWNWEALLERTAHTPLAPTAKSKSEARLGFPYIEATSGRINFKTGQEKKPYALLNADFALWQESENAWGVRLKAEPLRTDMSLSDTGQLRMNGTWQRAGSLRETPLQFSLEWDRGQLGQLTKLASGHDKGWRGEVRLDATLSGIPADLRVTADTSIQDFHRYDISSSGGLRIAAHCDAKYNSAEGMLREILCAAPVGNGMITLHGDAGLPGMRNLDLSVNLESVPTDAVVELARRTRKNLPADLVSTGTVHGSFSAREAGARPAEFQGRGSIADLRLQSASNRVDVGSANVPFALNTDDELHLEYGPFPVALGRPAPAQVRGWIGRSGYSMTLRGDAEVSRTLRLASLMGLPAVKANVEGAAQMDLLIAGSWTENVSRTTPEFSSPEVTGTVQLRNLRARVGGVNEPIAISSAELRLTHDEARVEKLSLQAANTSWTGAVALPRGCGTPGACLVRFNLNTDEMGLSDLYQWLGPQPSQRRWYQLLASAEPTTPPFLERLHATGKVNAGHLRIRDLVADRVSASLELDHGKLKVPDLRADLLGGKYHGAWRMDFTRESPAYEGTGTLTGISLQQTADAMHDAWISGTADGTYQLKASGGDSAAFWQSAEGELQFDLRDGVLPHISLPGEEGPLQITSWRGRARLRDGKIEVDNGKLVGLAGAYEVSGTASLGRVLDLKLTREAEMKAAELVYSITGTVAEPRIELTPAPETQAQLKP
jgi:hypothetical protein